MTGYLKSQRDRFDHPLFRDEKFCRGYAWDWLVAQAAWKPRKFEVKGKIIHLERGQLCVSVRYLEGVWGWSKSAVHRFLTRLQTETMIGTDSGTGQLVITICNYDKYQADTLGGGTEDGTASGTAAGQQRDKTEEGKEGKDSLDRGIPVDEFAEAVNFYNETATDCGWSQVQKISPARRSALNARLRDAGGLDGWREAIRKASLSEFLTGQTLRPFFASFDWLTKQSNFIKLMEGNYDNRSNGSPQPDPTVDAIAIAGGMRRTSDAPSF